jgi:DNA polymerase elongation subunit (family B)
MWDCICFNRLKKKKMVAPPIVKHTKNEAYVGAYVQETINGLHKWVASFDVASEYPSVIMGSNIGPETLIEPEAYTENMHRILEAGVSVDRLLNGELNWATPLLVEDNVTLTANGQFYRRDKQGFMAELVEEMFADRKVFKKKMLEAETALQKIVDDPAAKEKLKNEYSKYKNLQMAKKVSLNSLYGAFGSKYFRFYDIRNATAVTLTGQYSIRYIENRLNEFLNKILKTEGKDYVAALDTDSVYLLLDGLVTKTLSSRLHTLSTEQIIDFIDKACENGIQPVINRACNELGDRLNVYQQKIFMKREAICDKAIWTGKKRYVLNVWDNEGVRYSKPKRKVTGLEMIKSSTPSSCRAKLKEALDVILDKDEAAVQEFVANYRDEFKTLPLSEISFPKGCNGLTKYADKVTIYGKKTPYHVKGALFYNKLIQDGKLTKKYPLIANGDKLKFLPLKEPNPIRTDVISFPQGGIPKEFGLEKYIDFEAQFQKAFVTPLNFILHAIGWEAEKSSTGSLLDFL